MIINHIGAIRAEHDDFTIRFASSMNQVLTPPKEILYLQICYMCYFSVPVVYVFKFHIFSSLFMFVQLLLLKSTDSADIEWSKEVKGSMYDVIVEGFQLLSRWTARIWEQCAWKFSRPCKDPVPLESHETSASFSDYEKVLCLLFFFSG